MTATNEYLVAIFDDRYQAEGAVRDLETEGFAAEQLGFAIRGNDATNGGMITDATGTKDTNGAVAGAATGALAGGILGAAASILLPGVGPAVAVGILGAMFGFAAAGTAVGGILGAMVGLGISEEEATYYENAFRSGKAIVAVKPRDRFADAERLLRDHGGYRMQVSRETPVSTEGVFSKP